MGSIPSPPRSEPALSLSHPTDSEKEEIWASTHHMWGAVLSCDVYVERESCFQFPPGTKIGGITNWVLATAHSPLEDRLVMSSCESIRKRALVSTVREDGTVAVEETIACAIASVFSDPLFRGRGYASRMLREVGSTLCKNYSGYPDRDNTPSPLASSQINTPKDHTPKDPECMFSILYSDIGKSFYSKLGWKPFQSIHVSFPPSTAAPTAAVPLEYDDLIALCAMDEKMLRRQLSTPPPSTPTAIGKKTRVAIIPNLNSMLWHLLREDFMTDRLFSRIPKARGGMVGSREAGNRVWAVWTRNYYSRSRNKLRNTFSVLRFVVEDETMPREQMVDAFRMVINMAKNEATEWQLDEVQMWNPTPLTKDLVEASGLECKWVDREVEGIPSLLWGGEGDAKDVEWVANEKFSWC